MTDTTTPLPSLADRVRPIAASGGIVGVHFLGATPVFVLGEETLLFASEEGERRVPVHAGGLGVCAEMLSAGHRALQRRHALVFQRLSQAGDAGMEGLASERGVQP